MIPAGPLTPVVRYFTARPSALLLADAAGATISAALIWLLQIPSYAAFGIPIPALRVLGWIPIGFVAFDLVAASVQRAPALALRLIASLNIGYCVLTLALCWRHADTVTAIGWVYVVGEAILVGAIARVELEVARLQM